MENQQVVQAFLPHGPQKALADCISSWGMNRRCEDLDRARFRYPSKARPELAIVITNQVLGCEPIGGRFPELLCHPSIGRRACHAHMDDLTRLQFDEEEGKEWSKEQIGDLQEVTGPDLCGVSAQEGAPLLPSWLLCANIPHVLLDRPLAHTQAQFQEFPANPFSTPKPIVLGHLSDQGDGYFGDLRLAFPVHAKELSMPSEQGVWLHDEQSLLPRSNQPGQQDEEDAIAPEERWPFHLSLQNDELLAEERVFRDELGLASAKIGEGRERQGGHQEFCPTSKAKGEHIPAANLQPPERDKNTGHTRNFSIT